MIAREMNVVYTAVVVRPGWACARYVATAIAWSPAGRAGEENRRPNGG